MDESGCFFKALPNNGMAKKGKKTKGDKKSKERVTVAFSLVLMVGKLKKQLPFGKSKTLDVLLQNVRKSLIFQTQNHGCK